MKEVSKMARIKNEYTSKIQLENVKERKVPKVGSSVTPHVLRKWSEEAAQGQSKFRNKLQATGTW